MNPDDVEGPVRMPLQGLGIGGCAAFVVIYTALGLIAVTTVRALVLAYAVMR